MEEGFEPEKMEYVGFWARVAATLIDTLLLCAITWPILTAAYGMAYWMDERAIKGPLDFVLNYVFPFFAVVMFWMSKQATPGKMAMSARIVDAKTGGKPSKLQCIGRALATIISSLPFCVGLIWVAFDPKKQAWHDKLAGTVVIRPKKKTEEVEFDS